jgi:hypothetical protein
MREEGRGAGVEGPLVAQWAAASLRMADIICVHDFGLRELAILNFLRLMSFGNLRTPRDYAYFNDPLNQIAAGSRVTKGNTCTIVGALKRAFVIEERPEYYFSFRFPVENWKVPLRLQTIEAVQQLSLIEPPEHIRDALRASFVEQCNMPGKWPGLTNLSRPVDGRLGLNTGVPESGTPAISRAVPESGMTNRSRFGNGAQTPGKPGLSVSIPESGTAPINALMQPCQNAFSKHSCTKAAYVPESGTADGRARMKVELGGLLWVKWSACETGRLDPPRQLLFDILRAVGALGANEDSKACWLGLTRERPSVVVRLLLHFWPRLPEFSNVGGRLMREWQIWGRPDK